MAQQTPWQASDTSGTGGADGRRRIEITSIALQPFLTTLRRNWGYLFAAIGSIVVVSLLFRPWIVANGPDGRIHASPFGKMTVDSHLSSLWSGAPPKSATVNGTWAVLAVVAGTVAVLAFAAIVLGLLRNGTLLSRLATGSAVAMAFFVVAAMMHMNSNEAELRAMLTSGSPRDLGTQVGMLIRWASGNSSTFPIPGLRRVSYATSTLTPSAWVAGAAALFSALAAVIQWKNEHTTGFTQLKRYLPVVISRPAAESDHTDPNQQ